MATQVRSIADNENYATYLALPLLGLNKLSFGEGTFINSYFTENGKIVVYTERYINKDIPYWHHPDYLTDILHLDGIAIIYRCPNRFEKDMAKLLGSQFSKLSEQARDMIYEYSTLIVDFRRKDKKIVSSPLIHSLRYLKEDERELPLREQDILDNVDSDITFDTNGKQERERSV